MLIALSLCLGGANYGISGCYTAGLAVFIDSHDLIFGVGACVADWLGVAREQLTSVWCCYFWSMFGGWKAPRIYQVLMITKFWSPLTYSLIYSTRSKLTFSPGSN